MAGWAGVAAAGFPEAGGAAGGGFGRGRGSGSAGEATLIFDINDGLRIPPLPEVRGTSDGEFFKMDFDPRIGAADGFNGITATPPSGIGRSSGSTEASERRITDVTEAAMAMNALMLMTSLFTVLG